MKNDTTEQCGNKQEQQPEVSPSDTEKAIIAKMEFTRWNSVKINLELHGRQPKISQGQLWWTGVGKNQVAVVGDAKTMSTKRLYRMIG